MNTEGHTLTHTTHAYDTRHMNPLPHSRFFSSLVQRHDFHAQLPNQDQQRGEWRGFVDPVTFLPFSCH